MGAAITVENERDDDDLLAHLGGEDEQALTEMFAWHQGRLRRMFRLRLDRRLQVAFFCCGGLRLSARWRRTLSRMRCVSPPLHRDLVLTVARAS